MPTLPAIPSTAALPGTRLAGTSRFEGHPFEGVLAAFAPAQPATASSSAGPVSTHQAAGPNAANLPPGTQAAITPPVAVAAGPSANGAFPETPATVPAGPATPAINGTGQTAWALPVCIDATKQAATHLAPRAPAGRTAKVDADANDDDAAPQPATVVPSLAVIPLPAQLAQPVAAPGRQGTAPQDTVAKDTAAEGIAKGQPAHGSRLTVASAEPDRSTHQLPTEIAPTEKLAPHVVPAESTPAPVLKAEAPLQALQPAASGQAAAQPAAADKLPPLPEPPAPAPAAATPPHPTTQLASAVVALSQPTQPDSPQRLTIRLDPAELGHIQVRIERAGSGPAHVQVAVERPDTLLMLLGDKPRLEGALDQAGVPTEGRTVQFSLGQPGGGGSGGSGGGRWASGADASGAGSFAEDTAVPAPAPTRLRAGIDITA